MKKLLLTALISVSVLSYSAEWSHKTQQDWKVVGGMMQSPIDIVTKDVKPATNFGPLKLNLKNTTKEKIEDTGHALEVIADGKSVLNMREFTFAQVHMHSPSEHTIDSKQFPLELHFVHKAIDGRLGVVGVMAVEGAENKEFQLMLDNLKTGEGEVDLSKMLPKSPEYFHYLGSLTTPPLTENVEWYLFKEPITLSKAQIEAYQKYYNSNFRAVQPLNDRPVLFYSGK